MTHEELMAKVDHNLDKEIWFQDMGYALRAVVELHKPIIHALPDQTCWSCQDLYPCPTIQAIEKELR